MTRPLRRSLQRLKERSSRRSFGGQRAFPGRNLGAGAGRRYERLAEGFPGWRGRSGRKRRESAEKKSWGGKSPGPRRRAGGSRRSFPGFGSGWRRPLREGRSWKPRRRSYAAVSPSVRSRRRSRRLSSWNSRKRLWRKRLKRRPGSARHRSRRRPGWRDR